MKNLRLILLTLLVHICVAQAQQGGITYQSVNTQASVANQWIKSFNSTTGMFTTTQPAYSDLSGAPATGVIVWNTLGSATAGLSLSNGVNPTTFNQTSAANWTWANTTVATSGTSQSSPIWNLQGQYWTGAASANDNWAIQDILANGTNGITTLTFSHTGTTGVRHFRITDGASVYNDITFQGSTIALSNNSGAISLTGTGGFTLTGSGSASIALQAGATFSGTNYTFQNVSFNESTGNGGNWSYAQISELITLSTGGTTTDSAANLLPANSVIEAVIARVTTTITTATNWELGDATIAARFSAPNSTLTSGTTQVGTKQVDQTGTSGPIQTAAAKLRITTTGTPGAGAIRVTVFYRQYTPPTS